MKLNFTAVTQTDRPKSVRNSCAIKVFVAFFMLSRCFSVSVWAFVIGLSQISSFILLQKTYNTYNFLKRTNEAYPTIFTLPVISATMNIRKLLTSILP